MSTKRKSYTGRYSADGRDVWGRGTSKPPVHTPQHAITYFDLQVPKKWLGQMVETFVFVHKKESHTQVSAEQVTVKDVWGRGTL